MLVKAILSYFGGKRTLAPTIVEELGPHRFYLETCCGSLAVLFAKEPVSSETVVDLHGGVICLARVLADELQSAFLYERLRKTTFCDALHADAEAFLAEVGNEPAWLLRDDSAGETPTFRRADANMAEYAYHLFVASWQGRNGMAGTKQSNNSFCVRFTPGNGGDPAVRFRNAVESLPEWHERLRGVTILRRDLFDVLPRYEDTPGLAIYVDPPYLVKAAKYVHDFEAADHERLAAELRRFKQARVVVSYYADPRLSSLYPGWTQHQIEVAKATAVQGRRGPRDSRAIEVLLCNGPSLAQNRGTVRTLF